MKKIKTILFDLGGVIMTIDQEQAIRRFKEIGVLDIERHLDPYTQTGIFGDLECGKISDEEFRSRLSQMTGKDLSWNECQYAWLGYVADVPGYKLEHMLDLRRRGYRVVLLSNTNPFIMGWAMSDRFDGQGHTLRHYVDEAYLSYQCKAMKPDERFFRYVVEHEGLVADETLFVDDGPRNVKAAEAMGIHTLCPANGADWTDDLEQILKKYETE